MVDATKLAELSHRAKELNKNTDQLNANINALNKQLAAMNLGVEYWLEGFPLADTGLRQNSSYSPPRRWQKVTYLGYDKIHDAWQLAIREDSIRYEWDSDIEESVPVTESAYGSLLQASRDIRLAAVDQFDTLIRFLTQHLDRKLAALKRAGELAIPTTPEPESP